MHKTLYLTQFTGFSLMRYYPMEEARRKTGKSEVR